MKQSPKRKKGKRKWVVYTGQKGLVKLPRNIIRRKSSEVKAGKVYIMRVLSHRWLFILRSMEVFHKAIGIKGKPPPKKAAETRGIRNDRLQR
jgi:hypothetical protein